jgi:hypothetical protein
VRSVAATLASIGHEADTGEAEDHHRPGRGFRDRGAAVSKVKSASILSVDVLPSGFFSCPQCQASDTYEAVREEVKSYATEQAAKQLQAHIKDIATGSEFITYTPDRIETRNYRFIIDGM